MIPCPHPWCRVYFKTVAQLHAHHRRVHDRGHRCEYCAPVRVMPVPGHEYPHPPVGQ